MLMAHKIAKGGIIGISSIILVLEQPKQGHAENNTIKPKRWRLTDIRCTGG
jgi:hypothetical protein